MHTFIVHRSSAEDGADMKRRAGEEGDGYFFLKWLFQPMLGEKWIGWEWGWRRGEGEGEGEWNFKQA